MPTEDAVHYPSTSNYDLNSLYLDLFNFSVSHLKMGGRLVVWFPVLIESFDEDNLPQHKSLKIVSQSLQVLNKVTGRILISYEKIGEELQSSVNIEVTNLREK